MPYMYGGRVIWWLPIEVCCFLPTMGARMRQCRLPPRWLSLRSVLTDVDLYGPVARQASCRSISRHAIAMCSLLILVIKGKISLLIALRLLMSMAGSILVIRRDSFLSCPSICPILRHLPISPFLTWWWRDAILPGDGRCWPMVLWITMVDLSWLTTRRILR